MSDKYHKVIGIDLGTTYSAIAVYDEFNEVPDIIIDHAEGEAETTPSVVSIDPISNKAIVGGAAKRSLTAGPQGKIIEIKREMGQSFQNEKHLAQFNAQNAWKVGDPVQVFFADRWLKPQEISAFILMKMKEIAEKELGENIYDAVVTVPAFFEEPQKKATEEAVLMAGFYPRQLIPEPTAAAICYGLDKQESEKKTYLVYDLGGGTFDVTIIQVEEDKINPIATSGNSRLGGGDFDNRIRDWVVGQLQQQYQIDLTKDFANLARIKERAEQSKIILSMHPETKIDLIFLNRPEVENLSINRDTFEDLIEDLLRETLRYVDMAIKQSAEKRGITREQIDAILLVGGSSKIPKVRQMLLKYFNKDESFVRDEINPDTVVARGAAIMGFRFAPTPPPFDIRKHTRTGLMNVEAEDHIADVELITEHSLGVGLGDNTVSKIVEQGSNIPITVKRDGFANAAPTDHVIVTVYQGEKKYTHDNTLIGTLRIDRLDPNKGPGEHSFEITFHLDKNGLLTMTVLHLNENRIYETTFDQKTGVGGDDALEARRNMLVSLYASTVAHTAAGVPVPQTDAQDMPGAPVPPQRPDVAPPTAHPQTSPADQTVPPAAVPEAAAATQPEVEYQPQPQAATTVAQEAAPPPSADPAGAAQSTDGASPPSLIEPAVDVPEQFKQIFRRSKKLLTKQYDQELFDSLNAFSAALNENKPLEELEDIGDDLAEVFDDARMRRR